MKPNQTYEIEIGGKLYTISPSDIEKLDFLKTPEGHIHLIKDYKSFTIELITMNSEEKTMSVKVNDIIYHLKLRDQLDQLVQNLGLSANLANQANDVYAPMPGLILDILVEEGQKVSKGDALVILEAMKMENVIRASSDGMVSQINIEKKTTVDKGQVLVQFEDE